MTIFYLVQHAEKQRQFGDPGLTVLGRQQAARTARHLQDVGIGALLSSLWGGPVTVDLLRTLAGDDALEDSLPREGIPSCAVTTLDDLSVVNVASQVHLQDGR
ncbi:hypothetical protein AB0H77_18965 [Streptomyces sp. NPDC050844]|uniref:hypothetical protein n=1 Tax=Streptomyces sp. NPDC050844 TaxID=3155790 RepID=UPI0033F8BA0A